MWLYQERNHAGKCVLVFLYVSKLPLHHEAEVRRLLRVLLLWQRALSSCTERKRMLLKLTCYPI